MAKTNLLPLGDNVLIQFEKAESKTQSGIYIPETTSEKKPQQGKVVAIGESKDIKVKKGQIVIFKQYSGTEIEVDGQKYLIVENEYVLAVVEK